MQGLRPNNSVEEDSANDQIDASARIHLKDCYICQARVRAEGKAMERLAQLKPSETATRTPQCPPDSVWLEFAAGIHPDPEHLLAHAAQCDHCALLLTRCGGRSYQRVHATRAAQIAGLGQRHRPTGKEIWRGASRAEEWKAHMPPALS